MMVYLPAIFFGISLISSIRKYGWNVEAYLFLLYFLTGIASIMIDTNNLYEYNCPKMDIGFFAPLSYCFFLSLCVKPFGRYFRSDLINQVVTENEKIIDWFVYFCFCCFVIITFVSFQRIHEIFFNLTLKEVRNETYMGVRTSFYDSYSGLPRYICALSTFFYPMTYLCLLLFFYNIIYRKKKLWFHIITILASTTSLVSSILQADRSQFLYWGILFVFSFTVFYRQLNKKAIKKLLILIAPIAIGIISYFIAVSISRWGDDSSGGTIRYMGMNYFNYCYFANNLWHAPKSLCEIFPFTYFLLGKPGYFDFADIVSSYSHLMIATFPTFMGLILSISGPFVLVLYILIYRIFSVNFLRRSNTETITLTELIKMWIVVLVPLLGVFGYFYMEMNATLAIVFWLILGSFLRRT